MNSIAIMLIAFFVLNFTLTPGQTKIIPQIHLQPGDIYEMLDEITSNGMVDTDGTKQKIENNYKLIRQFKVLSSVPDGKYLIELSFLRCDGIEKTNGVVLRYWNTECTVTGRGSKKTNEAIKNLLSLKLLLIVTEQGKVEKVEDLDRYQQIFSGDDYMNIILEQGYLLETQIKESFPANILDYFPSKEVEPGNTWSIKKELSMFKESESFCTLIEIVDGVIDFRIQNQLTYYTHASLAGIDNSIDKKYIVGHLGSTVQYKIPETVSIKDIKLNINASNFMIYESVATSKGGFERKVPNAWGYTSNVKSTVEILEKKKIIKK